MSETVRHDLQEKLVEYWGADAELASMLNALDDDGVFRVFDVYQCLHGLFRSQKVEREFIRESQDVLEDRSVLDVLSGGEIETAQTFVHGLMGL